MKKSITAFMIISFAIIGCQRAPQEAPQQATEKNPVPEAAKVIPGTPAQQLPEAQKEDSKAFQPFYVYATKAFAGNHYIPSGYMPNSNCTQLKDDWG